MAGRCHGPAGSSDGHAAGRRAGRSTRHPALRGLAAAAGGRRDGPRAGSGCPARPGRPAAAADTEDAADRRTGRAHAAVPPTGAACLPGRSDAPAPDVVDRRPRGPALRHAGAHPALGAGVPGAADRRLPGRDGEPRAHPGAAPPAHPRWPGGDARGRPARGVPCPDAADRRRSGRGAGPHPAHPGAPPDATNSRRPGRGAGRHPALPGEVLGPGGVAGRSGPVRPAVGRRQEGPARAGAARRPALAGAPGGEARYRPRVPARVGAARYRPRVRARACAACPQPLPVPRWAGTPGRGQAGAADPRTPARAWAGGAERRGGRPARPAPPPAGPGVTGAPGPGQPAAATAAARARPRGRPPGATAAWPGRSDRPPPRRRQQLPDRRRNRRRPASARSAGPASATVRRRRRPTPRRGRRQGRGSGRCASPAMVPDRGPASTVARSHGVSVTAGRGGRRSAGAPGGRPGWTTGASTSTRRCTRDGVDVGVGVVPAPGCTRRFADLVASAHLGALRGVIGRPVDCADCGPQPADRAGLPSARSAASLRRGRHIAGAPTVYQTSSRPRLRQSAPAAVHRRADPATAIDPVQLRTRCSDSSGRTASRSPSRSTGHPGAGRLPQPTPLGCAPRG